MDMGNLIQMIEYLKGGKLHNNKAFYIHCIGWFFFIIYDAIIGGLVKGNFGTFRDYFTHYSLNIGLFYFHAIIILPIALRTGLKSIWRVPILLFLELALYEFAVFSINNIHFSSNNLAINGLNFNRSFVLAYAWRGLYFMLFSTGYYIFRRYKAGRDENERLKEVQHQSELNKEVMEKKLAESRAAFLFAQVNPHFLFNTLNYIYYTTVKIAPEAAHSITLLSRIMRYASDIENAGDLVPLNKEVEYVKWLMEIHQIRFKENFFALFSFSLESNNWKIIPFLLITVAENMLKHGVTTDPLEKAKLCVYIDEKKNLNITSKNKVKTLVDHSGLKSGLINLRERMSYYYHNRASLECLEQEDGYFELKISVPYIFKDEINILPGL